MRTVGTCLALRGPSVGPRAGFFVAVGDVWNSANQLISNKFGASDLLYITS